MPKSFDDTRTGTGTHEWAEFTFNIQRGCEHNCLYCYAAHNANRFKLRKRADWRIEELTAKAGVTSFPKKNGVVMFPSAHDITSHNLDAYIRVAKLILSAGNQLLIVSKPHLTCIERLLQDLEPWRDNILFRFSIGSMSPVVSAFWEPNAPPPAERLAALKVAFDAGFRTSVSAEPLLGGLQAAQDILAAVREYVTDTVWIGKLNKARSRVDMRVPANSVAVESIENALTDHRVMEMVLALDGDPLVRWKDSVLEVMLRHQSDTSVSTCIGCGCDNFHACFDKKAGHACSWLRVDRAAGRGVCSCCEHALNAWDAGDMEMRVPSK